MINLKIIKKTIFLLALSFVFFAAKASASSNGDVVNFNVDKDFDASQRQQVQATLIKTTNNL